MSGVERFPDSLCIRREIKSTERKVVGLLLGSRTQLGSGLSTPRPEPSLPDSPPTGSQGEDEQASSHRPSPASRALTDQQCLPWVWAKGEVC